MHPQNESGRQLEIMGVRWNSRSNNQPDKDVPDLTDHCSTVVQSPERVDHPELLGRKRRLFSAWTIKLHNDNQLRVEGMLECGRQARTKPIIQRINNSQVLSQSNHIYHLVGNISACDELPGFVRHRFQAGFPEDWETVIEMWKNLVASECSAAVRPTPGSDGLVVEKNLKLSPHDPMESDYFLSSRKVDRMQSNTPSTDDDHKAQSPRGFELTGESKRLVAWTPFILPESTVDHCMAFRGTLLSSMGLPVNKNHRTDAVRRRISARIIETVNRELYELKGDLNNTKRDVPKELVAWCRHGCPRDIDVFCEKWRTLMSNVNTYPRLSPQGEKRIGRNHERGAAIPNPCDKLASIENCSIDWASNMRMRENHKRKRISTEWNDSCNVNDNSISDNAGCGEQPATELIVNSPARRRPKMRRKMLIYLPVSSQGDENIAKVEHSTRIGRVSHETEEQRSSLPEATTLSFTYRTSAPNTDYDCILSDGV